MKKNNVRFYLIAISIILFFALGGGGTATKVQATAVTPTPTPPPGDFHFTVQSSNKNLKDKEEFNVKGTSTDKETIYVSEGVDNHIVQGAVVDWKSSDENIIKVVEDPNFEHIAYLERVAPGYAMITAVIKKQDGQLYNISCIGKVELAVDDGPGKTPLRADDILELHDTPITPGNPNPTNATQQVYLKYTADNTGIGDNTLVNWETSNPEVATVTQGGIITPIGSGSTTITITTKTTSNTNMWQTLKLQVVVNPTAKNPVTNSEESDFKITGSSDYTIETNALKASYLNWVVKKGTTVIPATGSDIMTYTASTGSNRFTINNAKAGTYEICAYVAVNGQNLSTPYLRIKFVVPVDISISDITMSKGDTYSLLKNSNIPSMSIFKFELTDSYADGGTQVNSIANLNETTGLINALWRGSVYLHITYIGGWDLFDIADAPTIAPIKITVIDGIELNMTEATIYTGGTLQLIAKSAINSEKKWTTSNPDVADFEDGVIVGKSEGIATITVSQTINGVQKTASCRVTVRKSVSSITIDPASVPLKVGEYTTLHAIIDPADISNISIKWISSDPTVVQIDKPNEYTTTKVIRGVAGGTALVFAINSDNVIVGFCKVTVPVKITSFSINPKSITAKSKSDTPVQLKAVISPTGISAESVKWISSNPSVATVSDSGLVTFVGSGMATITATYADDPSYTATCDVTVGTSVASIVLDDTKKTMYVGDTSRLTYMILPTNATSKEVIWTSSNTKVATVDSTGLVSAKSAGEAVITIKTADGTLTQSCTITVLQKATGVTLDVKDLELSIGQAYTLKATFTPANSTEITLTWESADPKIATVDTSGRVVGVSVGKTIITAKTPNSGVVFCNVTVIQATTGLKLNFNEKTIVIGEKFNIKATILPSNASTLDVIWTNSKSKVLSITSKGEVKGLSAGAAVITCKTKDGKFTETCVVQVIEPVTSIKLSKTSYKLGLGKHFTLKATVKSNAATNPKVTWVSSNKRIATVNSQGRVTAKKSGYVTITAKAKDKSGAEASCDIRIVKAVTSLSLSRTSVTMVEGRSNKLKAIIKPSNATYKTAIWTSSNEEVAIVSTNGTITALKEGVAIITATAKDSSGKKAKCHVVVKPVTPASSVTILNQNLTMLAGESNTLQKAINPSNSTDRYTWESDNKTVASVNRATGRVTANTPGIANVTVMTESGKTATTKVTVVGLNTKKLKLEQYSLYQLEVIGVDANTVTWNAANSEIAVVNNGLVESRRTGTTTITAIVNGRRLTCKLTVVKIN